MGLVLGLTCILFCKQFIREHQLARRDEKRAGMLHTAHRKGRVGVPATIDRLLTNYVFQDTYTNIHLRSASPFLTPQEAREKWPTKKPDNPIASRRLVAPQCDCAGGHITTRRK